nr:hypothetical protein [Dyella sp. ASV24]
MKVLVTALMATTLLAGAATARAQTLSFNLTGKIQASTCQLTASYTALPTTPVSLFIHVGSRLRPTTVNINVSQCDPAIGVVHLRYSGPADSNDATIFRGIDGIGVHLSVFPDASSMILPSGTTVDYVPTKGAFLARVTAAYYQTAETVAVGKFATPVTVQMTYN